MMNSAISKKINAKVYALKNKCLQFMQTDFFYGI
jgi:hypothetical protein